MSISIAERLPLAAARAVGSRPRRRLAVAVAALDFPSADNALALGVMPVGMAEVTYVDSGVLNWTKAALGDHKPEIFNVDNGFPFETIAKLNPNAKRVTACAGSPPDTQKIGFAQL